MPKRVAMMAGVGEQQKWCKSAPTRARKDGGCDKRLRRKRCTSSEMKGEESGVSYPEAMANPFICHQQKVLQRHGRSGRHNQIALAVRDRRQRRPLASPRRMIGDQRAAERDAICCSRIVVRGALKNMASAFFNEKPSGAIVTDAARAPAPCSLLIMET